jgi:hypothetical protein
VEAFDASIQDSMRTGRFLLVLVLDDAAAGLVPLVGYSRRSSSTLLRGR